MAAGAQTRGWDQPSRRRAARYGVQAPLDVTVLRSGIPDTLPGRSLNMGEGGLAAVIAGELLPGEAVGVEIHLPLEAGPLRTRANVRHHDKLQSGMEFVGMSAQQRAAIRAWAGTAKAEPDPEVDLPIPAESGKGSEGGSGGGTLPPSTSTRRTRGWVFLLVSTLVLIGGLWWRWNHGWRELEAGLPKHTFAEANRPQAHVPVDVMQKLVTHRVDPEYPQAARLQNLHGVIMLDIVVGCDGSVVDMRPLNGPDVLAQAAMDALRWWRFEPYRQNGEPIVVETTVAVEFKP